jgi:hypothetical protein
MVRFTKQTTSEDEYIIEREAAGMREKGFQGDMIVYRNNVDASLANIALYSTKLSDAFLHAVHPQGIFTLIATKNDDDGKKLREKVEALRAMIAPAFA